MNVTTKIKNASAAVKSVKFDTPDEQREFDYQLERELSLGIPPELAERLALLAIMNESGELGDRYANDHTPLRHWLYFVRQIRDADPAPKITVELFSEWRAARDGYRLAPRPEGCYRATPEWRGTIDYTRGKPPYDQRAAAAEEIARWKEYKAREAAREAAEAATKTETAKRDAAARARCDAIVARLQASVIKPVELNPVNWQELHKLKKHPNKAKRDLAQRWSERFEALPDNVQHAWQAFYGSMTIMSPATDDPVDDADESDDDAEQTLAPSADAQIIHLTPYPPGKRDIHDGNADVVQAGVRDPAFRAFIPFSEGVRRLFDLIGNPIDDVILPPHDPYRPEPAQAVDDIADDGDVDDIVPGLIPRDGLTVAHGDSKHGKSLFMQKLAIVIADDSGAKFEGIEVEHGQVIYATLDPGAEAKRIKPGVLEIRDRLGLQPSGRLHLTNAALILNEPASVADWIELNKARLPCKLIVVDSLFSAVAAERSLITDTVVRGAMDGVRMLLRHSDAVVLVHHDNKGGDIFGSVFLNAMMVSKAGVVRDVHRDGRLGDHVTVTVEFLKFASAELKLAYRLDGPFLGPAESADSARVDRGPVKRPDLLELLAPTPMPRGAARALVVAKLRGKPEARGKQWLRLLEHWIERGAVIDDGDTIRRVI